MGERLELSTLKYMDELKQKILNEITKQAEAELEKSTIQAGDDFNFTIIVHTK